MTTQINKFGNKPKPLYTKKIRYIAIRKIVERPEPLKIQTMETYSPYRGESEPGEPRPLARYTTRKKTIEIKLAATHEVHLARDTVTDSMDTLNDPTFDIAAIVNIYGGTRTILNNRPSGSGVYICGEGAEEMAYFVLTWKQVLPIPDHKKLGNTHARRERYRYPTENLSRIEDGAKVYYLQKASPEELKIIIETIKSVKGDSCI